MFPQGKFDTIDGSTEWLGEFYSNFGGEVLQNFELMASNKITIGLSDLTTAFPPLGLEFVNDVLK